MSVLDTLVRHFEKFPGIGSRQAKRFAFHILTLNEGERTELSKLIGTINESVIECTSCRRYFTRNGGTATECGICSDRNRDRSKLLVVERDNDITPIERSGVYDGLYFVLGGTVPLLDGKEDTKVRGNGLKHIVETRLASGLSEVILGFAVNPDGENTARFVEQLLSPYQSEHSFTISHLGRGLSTGSELEYADPETIKNALKNRS
jgi:recombination protein RecR